MTIGYNTVGLGEGVSRSNRESWKVCSLIPHILTEVIVMASRMISFIKCLLNSHLM